MRRGKPDSFTLIFGGTVLIGFMLLYSWFGIFPNQSTRGREPIVLSEHPDRFWLAVAIGVAAAVLVIGLGVAKMFRR